MQITMTTEYAVRALLCLSAGDMARSRRIGDVASEAQVPESYLRKIIPILAKAGFVHSTVGVTGGVQLSVHPEELTLLDVYEAVEGKMSLNKCLINSKVCHRSPYCSVHAVWVEVQASVKTRLREKSLAALSRENAVNLARYLEAGSARAED